MSALARFRLDGKVALLAGAGRGIGAASALALAEAGADVVVLARTQSEIDEVADQARAFGRRALALAVDMAQPGSVGVAVERVIEEFGRLDILVSVTGGARPGPFLKMTDDALRESFERNVVHGLDLVRTALPHLLKSDGASVIMVSSAIGHVVGRGYVAYGSGKAALDHSVRLLSVELNPKVRVNAVAPGAVLTDALEVVAANPDMKAALERNTPLGRIGDPEDIAAAVLYLASPAAAYVTGQVLAVDGGLVTSNLAMPFPNL
ncbi:MAG: SDR family oxidoreductase [Jatrophihabitans sp.]